MIIFKRDESIFDSSAAFIVNPVNTKGISGAGLALEMKKRFPENFKHYHKFCSESLPKGGDFVFYIPEASQVIKGERAIINFCTKEDWKKPSKLEWVEKGIKQLINVFEEKYLDGKYPTPLLALPMLGCGKGGLEVDKVLGVFTNEFKNCKYDVEVYL
jgi:O-acetyl-ADP-ribose deacetylase (regulator of RNase III)